jgi:hypothetical protein
MPLDPPQRHRAHLGQHLLAQQRAAVRSGAEIAAIGSTLLR